jgi:pre-mRNA-splicing factor SYF1
MYTIYIAKATANYGLPATRPIYQRAIEVLPDRQTAEMCLRFAAMERKLGEIDRARAIYAHASQFCDPRTYPEFWKEWNSFESKSHGLGTSRGASLTIMLYQSTLVRRIPSERCCASSDQCRRHSIPSTCLIGVFDKARANHRSYSRASYLVAQAEAARKGLANKEGDDEAEDNDVDESDPMARMEREAAPAKPATGGPSFVRGTAKPAGDVTVVDDDVDAGKAAEVNPDAINMDDLEDDDDEDE